jgi:hypothetical protein
MAQSCSRLNDDLGYVLLLLHGLILECLVLALGVLECYVTSECLPVCVVQVLLIIDVNLHLLLHPYYLLLLIQLTIEPPSLY